MAFESKNLRILSYANNFSLWHYITSDQAVLTTGYFNNAADIIRVGDLIIANIDTDGKQYTKFYIVTANTGSVVTVTVYA